jgi:hypothetical protein
MIVEVPWVFTVFTAKASGLQEVLRSECFCDWLASGAGLSGGGVNLAKSHTERLDVGLKILARRNALVANSMRRLAVESSLKASPTVFRAGLVV